jgi:hypothetical protein
MGYSVSYINEAEDIVDDDEVIQAALSDDVQPLVLE